MGNAWRDVANSLANDFSSVSPAELAQLVVRLLVAALLAGVLGYEREKTGKSAGVRTHMLIALGAALFVIVAQQVGMTGDPLSRVIQGLIAGIGFLGAGAILKMKDNYEIHGLTTAAGIWLTAAVGMAAGLGQIVSAVVGAVLAWIVLALLPRPEGGRSSS